jgi:hypothetical protein
VPDSPDAAQTRPPGARDLLTLLIIAPAVTAVLWWADRTPIVSLGTAVIVAAGAAGVFGIPPLYWALDHGRASVAWLASLGGVAAALFPVVLVVSGMAGQLLLGGRRYALMVAERAAPIPGVGQIFWSSFAALVVLCVAIGAASGAAYAIARQQIARRTRGAA